MNEWEWHLLEDKPAVENVSIRGRLVKVGDNVRLCPRKGGDIMDIALAGKLATVESIEQDYEGQIHLAVVIDDDPGRDIGMMRQPGHRFFFDASEVEPVERVELVEQGDATGPESKTGNSANKTPTILIAGIGNIFLGDDAFGVEVANRLAKKEFPASVKVVDFGIRGIDLAYALMDGADFTILVDACPRGGVPGDLYVIEPDLTSLSNSENSGVVADAHSMNPMNVIRSAQSMGGTLKKILLVGCEPQTFGPEEGLMELSEVVADAVDRAIPLIDFLVSRLLNGDVNYNLNTDRKSETSNS